LADIRTACIGFGFNVWNTFEMRTHIEDLTAEIQDDVIVCSFWTWEDGSETVSNVDHMEIRPHVLANWIDEVYAKGDEDFPTTMYMIHNLQRLVREYLEVQLCAA
jgi:hypothetical protein